MRFLLSLMFFILFLDLVLTFISFLCLFFSFSSFFSFDCLLQILFHLHSFDVCSFFTFSSFCHSLFTWFLSYISFSPHYHFHTLILHNLHYFPYFFNHSTAFFKRINIFSFGLCLPSFHNSL